LEYRFDLSLKSLYLFALSFYLIDRFVKCRPQAMSLKLVVEGLELMAEAFKRALKLYTSHFLADLSEA
jgi:hypothetical protein